MADEGYTYRQTTKSRGGIYATRTFKARQSVMKCTVTDVFDQRRRGAVQAGEHIFVSYAGEFSRVNHSCAPNCGIKTNDDGSYEVVARRAIDAGEEVTLDFAMHNYDIGKQARCRCGAATCRGLIQGWKDLSEETKTGYEGFAATYLLALDNKYRDSD